MIMLGDAMRVVFCFIATLSAFAPALAVCAWGARALDFLDSYVEVVWMDMLEEGTLTSSLDIFVSAKPSPFLFREYISVISSSVDRGKRFSYWEVGAFRA